MTANLYQPIQGEVVDVIEESPTIKSFVIVPQAAFKFDTGQFVELTLPGEGEAPFTPSSSPSVSERMEITIMNAGRITARFHACAKGQSVAIRGPYGKGYPIDEFIGKEIYIVGGGVGLAPIRSLFLTLVDRIDDFKSVVCRFGARTPERLHLQEHTVRQLAEARGCGHQADGGSGQRQLGRQRWGGHDDSRSQGRGYR